MIQIILVNEESRASQYGIGTYIKQLCLILSQKQGIHLSVICCRSTKNDFYIERKGNIDYIIYLIRYKIMIQKLE